MIERSAPPAPIGGEPLESGRDLSYLAEEAAFGITKETSVLRNFAITVCGLIALFSPLFLWMAWDRAVFWVVLAVGCGAVVAVFLLVRMSPEERL